MTPAPLSIVVLAAGAGTRMRSSRPKVLQPLAGRPMLARVLDTARALAPEAIHVVHGFQGAQVRDAFADAPDLHWVEQARQLGTGHAVMQALPAVPDAHRVLVLCGDVPLLRPETLATLLGAARAGAGVLTVHLDDPTGYGRIVRDRHEHVLRIVEERDADEATRAIREVNTGVIVAPAGALARWLARTSADNAQGEYYLTDIVALAAAEGMPLVGVAADNADEVAGINDRRQLAAAEAALRAREAQALLAVGATLADPRRIDVRGRIEVGQDVFIDVNVVLEGEIVLGDDVHIGPGCVLRDVKLGAGTRVHPHSVIEDCETGAACELGPFARIRPGCRFADRVKIGNFVEVKNTRIAAGSKANHLTYLGDSEIATGVNIGAGTITCNYDGANKHRTVIEADVFVGSGVQIVAPLTIGAGATIAAGTTLTRDAPAGQLSVGRTRQTAVPHWQRPTKKA